MPAPYANLSGDVIAALSTAPGLGGVAMIRASGEGVYALLDQMTRLRVAPSERPANTFVHAALYGAEGEVLDDAVLLFYRAPQSYTGEDTIELCVHGGAVVSQRVLERLYALGARPAEPGEFTKRAFLNGRLDLTQAEAVADLIAARSPRAERAARANLQGRLGEALTPLYEDTLTLSAEVEHLLDFDEGELPDDFYLATADRLNALTARVEALLATWHEGRLLREGALVVLAGKPNAGKSSLLNLLLGYDRAIVCDEPGTTRDSIEETFLLDGVPLRLTDTAGLREAPGIVEHQGVDRARALLAQADVVLYLIACNDEDSAPNGAIVLRTKADLLEECGMRNAECGMRNEIERRAESGERSSWRSGKAPASEERFSSVGAPTDIHPSLATAASRKRKPSPLSALRSPLFSCGSPLSALRSISVKRDPEGARKVVEGALREALKLAANEAPHATLATARQFAALQETKAVLHEAHAAFRLGDAGYVPAAQHLRTAANALGQLLGRTYSDDLLDRVFSSFCVGK